MSRENVKVFARIRPLSNEEIIKSNGMVAYCCSAVNDQSSSSSSTSSSEDANESNQALQFNQPGSISIPLTFTFDKVFDVKATQEQVYNECKESIMAVLKGLNTSIIAYGQTGSGKTHTMMGKGEISDPIKNPDVGIVPRIAKSIFDGLIDIIQEESSIEATVKVSACEIYMEKIFDLLNPFGGMNQPALKIRELIDDTKASGQNHQVFVEGLREEYVTDSDELLEVISRANASRVVASTMANRSSSRSHALITITVTQKNIEKNIVLKGKLVLVDLAGSEAVKKTHATGNTLDEAKTINKSLSALGNVIKALVEGKSHIPYRDSKLTRLLQDTLGGNCKTALMIALSPSMADASETLSTIRFGTRAKSIQNKPIVNEEKSIEEYKALLSIAQEKIESLMTQLNKLTNGGEILTRKTEVSKKEGDDGGDNEEEIENGEKSITNREEDDDDNASSSSSLMENNRNILIENERLTIELSEERQERQVVEDSLRNLQEKNIDLEEQLASMTAEKETLKSDKFHANSRIEKLEFENNEIKLEIDALRKANDILMNDLKVLEGGKTKRNLAVLEEDQSNEGLGSGLQKFAKMIRIGASSLTPGASQLFSASSSSSNNSSNNSPNKNDVEVERDTKEVIVSSSNNESSASKSSISANNGSSITDEKGNNSEIKQMEMKITQLEENLAKMTDKYIACKLELSTAEEQLKLANGTSKGKDFTEDVSKLRALSKQLLQERDALMTHVKILELAVNAEKSKLDNREKHIAMLEEALHSFQKDFKIRTEEWISTEEQLKNQITLYKKVLSLIDGAGRQTVSGSLHNLGNEQINQTNALSSISPPSIESEHE